MIKKFEHKYLLSKFFIDHYENILLISIIIAFLTIRTIFIFTKFHLMIWDESVYLGMGKYLYSAGNIGLWESIRPIGLSLLTGLYWVLGHQLLLSQITAILFSSATLIITYKIAKIIFNSKIAILSIILLAICPVFFYYSGFVLTDIPSTFFIMLTIYMMIDRNYFLAGISSAIAFMLRFPSGLILAVILLFTIFDEQKIKGYIKRYIKNILLILLAFGLIILPFIIFNYISYKPYVANPVDAAFRPIILGSMHQSNIYDSIQSKGIIGILYNLGYYPAMMFYDDPLLILSIIFLIVWIIGIVKGENPYQNIVSSNNIPSHKKISPTDIICISLIVFLLYLTIISNKQERFLISILPILCITAASIIYKMFIMRKKTILGYILFAIIAAIMIVCISYNIETCARYYSWEQDKPPAILQYYTYFDTHNITGPIMTTTPIFTAYSEKKYIPYYDTVGGGFYINEWEIYLKHDAIAYVNSSFPCADTKCEDNINSMYYNIFNNSNMVYNQTFDNVPHYIFLLR